MLEIICGIVIVLLVLFALGVSGLCLFMAGVKAGQNRSFEETFPHVFVGIVFLCIAVAITIITI